VPKILVADDNSNIQKMVTLAFQERAIDVTAVGNGEAAVRRIPDLKPDLILADVFMPVRNGYEVCEFVKKNVQFSHIPVILMVGAFDPLDEKEARRVGADGVLKKPFVPPDPLIAMVTAALERNPKLAAELAKAKETVAVLPPSQELESPLKIEPKPLPEFPEPTPEEAALAYGFGSGKRDLDGDNEPGASREAKAPAFERDEENEELDEAPNSGDWRRAAMDFEIPEEAAKGPAHSVDMGQDAEMFPSEGDVAPKDIRVQEQVEEVEPVVLDQIAEPELAPSEYDIAPIDVRMQEPIEEAQPVVLERTPEPELAASEYDIAPIDDVRVQEQVEEVQPVVLDRAPEPEPSEPVPAAFAEVDFAAVESAPPPNEEIAVVPEALPAWRPPEPEGEDAVASESEAEDSWFDEPMSVEESEQEVVPETVECVSAGFDSSLVVAPGDEAHSEVDTNLAEPSLVQVTPEPLLVSGEEQESPDYDLHQEEIPPLRSSFESWPVETNERIPTAPPAHPDVLSDIPFLTPPSPLPAEAEETNAASPEAVDALVRRLLEKIGPQLHEVLSQGLLKPLVEELVQKELAKKE
jgi:CheY-like chemotaxis protein